MTRAAVTRLSLVDTDRDLPLLAASIRGAAQRRLERRVSDLNALKVCAHCTDPSSFVDRIAGEGLCGDHAAAFVYFGRRLDPVEAVIPVELL